MFLLTQGRVQARCTPAELDCVRWRGRPGRRWVCSGVRPVVLFFSSPVHRGGVEPLERLCGPVQTHGPRAEARGAAGAPERRRALPGPGGESRLPGVRDAPGPGLRARLRYCAFPDRCPWGLW